MQIQLPPSKLISQLSVETPSSVEKYTCWPGETVAEIVLPEGVTEDHIRVTLCHLGNNGKPIDEAVEVHSPKGQSQQELLEAEQKAEAERLEAARVEAEQKAE